MPHTRPRLIVPLTLESVSSLPWNHVKALLLPCPDVWVKCYLASQDVSFARNEGPHLIESQASRVVD